MKYGTQFQKYTPDDLEVNSGELITEQAGYIPPNVQIENMILAGKRLDDIRSMYDWNETDEIDEMAEDPTRRPNFDMAEASQIAISLEEKAIKARQDASKGLRDTSEPLPNQIPVQTEKSPEKG